MAQFIPPDVVAKAKEMDLYTYLRNYEPSELVHFSGNTYTTKTHDSLKISNGKWMWWSQGIGGKSALDYLIKVKGLEFTEAVQAIAGNVQIRSPVITKTPKKPTESQLLLPQKHRNNDKVIAYLFNRGIDFDIIYYCIEKGLIFESLPKHNAVFIGLDNNLKPRYAAYRGTGSERFIGDASGSDKGYSFRLLGNSNTVHLFESAIDLLSYATLLKHEGIDWKKENLLSLAGVYQPQKDITKSKVPKALEQFLKENDSVKRVVFHLDNDYVGRLATKAITTVLPEKYLTENKPPPTGKDYNDYLCMRLGLYEKQNTNERTDVR